MTTDVSTCGRKWNEMFLKLNFSSEKFKEKLFLDKRNVFSKKGGYVLEEYFKKPRLWNI